MSAEIYNGLVWGTVAGLACGMVPMMVGMRRNQPGLAIGGFFACIVVGAGAGLILAVPVAALFWWVLKKAENKSKDFKE